MRVIRRGVEFEPGLTVTDEGKVYSTKSGESIELKTTQDRYGYTRVRDSGTDRRKRTWRIHRLVASFFVPNPNKKPDVNHIDGNPDNPHYSNLEWVTHKENCRKGRNAKLTQKQADEIRRAPTGYGTGRALAKKYGVSPATISAIRRRGYWKT